MNETETTDSTPLGMGVRTIKLRDQAPCCRIAINESLYDLSDVVAGKKVADIGCGYGRLRDIVESAGGEWVGIEPFDTPADARKSQCRRSAVRGRDV